MIADTLSDTYHDLNDALKLYEEEVTRLPKELQGRLHAAIKQIDVVRHAIDLFQLTGKTK